MNLNHLENIVQNYYRAGKNLGASGNDINSEDYAVACKLYGELGDWLDRERSKGVFRRVWDALCGYDGGYVPTKYVEDKVPPTGEGVIVLKGFS